MSKHIATESPDITAMFPDFRNTRGKHERRCERIVETVPLYSDESAATRGGFGYEYIECGAMAEFGVKVINRHGEAMRTQCADHTTVDQVFVTL